jgi:hypothetical protein
MHVTFRESSRYHFPPLPGYFGEGVVVVGVVVGLVVVVGVVVVVGFVVVVGVGFVVVVSSWAITPRSNTRQIQKKLNLCNSL